ncbi:MAG: ROK family transcriptional regulator [Oscillospiraceae bacterium]|nr:ROK family transcriptional regulator [Oscillospiraceae bacterium]
MPIIGNNMVSVKRKNRSAALRLLQEEGSMSRKRLAEKLGLTPAAITKIAGEMLAEGLLREGDALPSGSAGRREILMELNPHSFCALGILINLRQAIISALWLDSSVIFSKEIPLPASASAESTVQMLCDTLMALTEEYELPREKIVGIGIAVRGICSADGRTVVDSFGALSEKRYPLCRRVEEMTGFPAVMANNVRALFAAQMFLAHDKSSGAQFFLRCEYGIGASLAINGQIWHGVSEQCAEIGHIPVIPRGGKPCSCGKAGCLETISSPTAICEDARSAFSEEKTPLLWSGWKDRDLAELQPEDVLEAARNGDLGACEIVDRAVKALASALKAVIYLFDPGKIVFYGKLFDNPYYLSRLLSEMREGVDSRHEVSIEKSAYNHRLENRAAGLLAVERFFSDGGEMPVKP